MNIIQELQTEFPDHEIYIYLNVESGDRICFRDKQKPLLKADRYDRYFSLEKMTIEEIIDQMKHLAEQEQ